MAHRARLKIGASRRKLAETVTQLKAALAERDAIGERLRHLSLYDGLTGLANRELFRDRMEHSLAAGDRKPGSLAVLFLDVDDFRTVNNSMGHPIGDELLKDVADRLRGALRPSDTPARLGGDEFAVLIEDVTSIREACLVAERVAGAFEAPFEVKDRNVFLRAGIGLTVSSDTRDTPQALLRDAEAAMYVSKRSGSHYEVFEPGMREAVIERLELKHDLQRALDNDELFLVFQPVFDLNDHEVVALETLLRWRHPERGLISPLDFVTLAEETGLIVPIGAWVLEQSCRQAIAWQRAARAAEPPRMSVNISGRQLTENDFVRTVRSILRDTGMPGDRLLLEVTESVLVNDQIASTLQGLKDLGAQIAIDDFGTGYSSLAYLNRFPIDILKVDRSFVRGVMGDARESALAHAIVKLAHTFELSTIAEGIETRGQLEVLRAWDCGMGQGFLYSEPLDATAAGRILNLNGKSHELTQVSASR